MRYLHPVFKLLKPTKIAFSLQGVPRKPSKKPLDRSLSDHTMAQTMLQFLQTHADWLPSFSISSRLRRSLAAPLFENLPVFVDSLCIGLAERSPRYRDRLVYLQARNQEAQMLRRLKCQLAVLHDDVADQLLLAQSSVYEEGMAILKEIKDRVRADRNDETLSDYYAVGPAFTVLATECPRPPKRTPKQPKVRSQAEKNEALADLYQLFQDRLDKGRAASG